MMTNNSETVREVCAEMKDQNKSGIAQSYWNDTTVHIVDAWHCVEAYSDRLLSAYEREMAAKDTEIERLKEERNHARLDAQRKFSVRIELLERALKPVIKCKVYECDYGLYTGQGFEQTNVRSMCHNAVREAQRIMKEGENNDK